MKPSALFLLLTVSLVMLPQTSQAQRIASPAFALFRPAPTPAPATPVSFIHSSAPDLRWEGLVIGAIAGGAFVAYVVGRFCSGPDSGGGSCALPLLEGTLAGATVGGVTGGLLGLLFPKNHSASTH